MAIAFAGTMHALAVAFGVASVGFGFVRPGFTAGASLAVGPEEQGIVAGRVTSVNGMVFVLGPSLGIGLYAVDSAPALPRRGGGADRCRPAMRWRAAVARIVSRHYPSVAEQRGAWRVFPAPQQTDIDMTENTSHRRHRRAGRCAAFHRPLGRSVPRAAGAFGNRAGHRHRHDQPAAVEIYAFWRDFANLAARHGECREHHRSR